MARPGLIAALLLVCCFIAAVLVEPALAWSPVQARHAGAPIETILGDARKLFAGHFFIKADVYFHNGYYPSIFDSREAFQTSHIAADAGAVEDKNEEEKADFLGAPRDIIERFGRAFFPSSHTHLEGIGEGESHEGHDHEPGAEHHDEDGEAHASVREILPWLSMAVAMDPNRVETYTVGAYWLRNQLGKPKEAEALLREGLRNNPGSYAILYELGRIFAENYKDSDRARNTWEAALRRWNEQEGSKKNPDNFLLGEIAWGLARLEESAGNNQKAISYLELAKKASPYPENVQKRIDELKQAQPK